ncbi:hypothetical protein BpHYR1_006830 [Brachionus plicatilis]|uniref:Uncharacterized protein n=1 Tax=Brachionus plicatilis TaxID=10195 RepID=A0A3M7QLP5_BRAPC|nr:hypothetical protein BpHYR1_006830 [Brachionus plicatilis]
MEAAEFFNENYSGLFAIAYAQMLENKTDPFNIRFDQNFMRLTYKKGECYESEKKGGKFLEGKILRGKNERGKKWAQWVSNYLIQAY